MAVTVWLLELDCVDGNDGVIVIAAITDAHAIGYPPNPKIDSKLC